MFVVVIIVWIVWGLVYKFNCGVIFGLYKVVFFCLICIICLEGVIIKKIVVCFCKYMKKNCLRFN